MPIEYLPASHTFDHKHDKDTYMLDVLLNRTGNEEKIKNEIRVSDRADKPLKSMLKSISWRIVGTIDTMIISYFITGKISLAVSIGSVEVLTKTILYYFHERLWAHIHKIRIKLKLKANGKQFEVNGVKSAE